jgi:hypothetical protein
MRLMVELVKLCSSTKIPFLATSTALLDYLLTN